MTLRVLHIVRRFGCVGGMETYVWHLTHELANLGLSVEVLCQSVEGDADPKILLHRLQPSPMRRRWKAMRDFRQKCDDFWRDYPNKDGVIVHSHERCNFHHVTTFHGPPMKAWSETPWYQNISPRVKAWRRWEATELLGCSVKRVVPVSKLAREKLAELYPESKPKLALQIEPGLIAHMANPAGVVQDTCRVIFVGKEWRRKGLVRSLAIIDKLRMGGIRATLDIYGPSRKDLQGLELQGWVKSHGWQKVVPYHDFDLLIHPALQEPFGMVVIEALAAGCRVLMSDRVGAAGINNPFALVKSLSASDEEWVVSLVELLNGSSASTFEFQSWGDVAQRYVNEIYDRLFDQ